MCRLLIHDRLMTNDPPLVGFKLKILVDTRPEMLG